MTDTVTVRGIPARSMGLKLLLVCGLALLMTIPALFVFGLLWDRTHRAEATADEIGGLVGGPQTFLGPVVAVPWHPPQKADQKDTTGVLVLFPEAGKADVSTHTEVRKRSLFSVPVYTADLAYSGGFDLSGAEAQAPTGAELDGSHAEFLIGASDARGARSDVKLDAGGRSLALAPASTLSEFDMSNAGGARPAMGEPTRQDRMRPLRRAGLRLRAWRPDGAFRGQGRDDLHRRAPDRRPRLRPHHRRSNPRRLGFALVRRFLPPTRQVAGDGPRLQGELDRALRRPRRRGGGAAHLGSLGSTEMAVAFVEPANPYQSVARSLKYALLFVGLVFLAYFVFETASGKRLHPAQYVLVGLAQIIFYLCCSSISEQLGFDTAFLIAAARPSC